MEIDRSDLTYRPKVDTSEFVSKYSIESVEKQKKWAEEKEEQQRQMQEYWALVKYAKSQLYSYYGTACHYFPAARADLMKIKSMSPEEILDTASRSGLI